ncbi:transcriptional repressor LexA [Streptacidiphilus melanogenes]|uniref:transcriptional repressor LexA n=1 Tax=Streptacidiphilus melanogenes TaxID=411235 RepID=UPI0005AA9297|nr:transcriptional repressor LexA [Streptacidiphilus melanogenes]
MNQTREDPLMEAQPSRGRPAGTARSARGLTARQEAVLEAIDTWAAEHGYPPSLREIGKVVGLASTSSVSHQVRSLEHLGYLRKDPHRPRCYALTGLARDEEPLLGGHAHEAPEGADVAPVLVPLVGQIAAGVPITADQHVEELLPLPPAMLPAGGEFFALRVVGDSMTGARILDGDTVVVRAAQAADHGDIVAALIDDEATVKRLHHGGRTGSWLVPANDAYTPISAADARILGKVVAVLRKV